MSDLIIEPNFEEAAGGSMISAGLGPGRRATARRKLSSGPGLRRRQE